MTIHFHEADRPAQAIEKIRTLEFMFQMILGFASGITVGFGIVQFIWLM